MRRIFFIFLGFAMLMDLAGCETVKGIGRDITNSSSAVQGALSSSNKQQATKYLL